MKYLHLVWAELFRRKTRTFLTLVSILAAFLLFGLLDSVRVAFDSGGSIAGADRLVVTSRLSFTHTLPYRMLAQVEAVPGVERVAYANWFGGIYREPRNFFPNFAVSDDYFDVYRELILPPAQLQAFRDDRMGAVVGQSLADKFGWKIGDRIPLRATIPTAGSNEWTFTLRGIFHVPDHKMKGQENQFMFHWKYFDQANDYFHDQIGWFMVDLRDVGSASDTAKAIDALSANSDHETKTQTERAWQQAFVKQFADVGALVSGILGAVFFTLLLLTGNTMAQAVRERTPSLAVLKCIGFSDRSVLRLVLAESTLLVVTGGMLGMGLASAIVVWISPRSRGLLPDPFLPLQTWTLGVAAMLVLGLVVGLVPALRVMRMRIVDALAGR